MEIFRTLWYLLLMFVVLKLTGNIGWSWFWVLMPFLVPFFIFMFMVTYYLITGVDNAE